MNSQTTEYENWIQKRSKFERELEQLEITIGTKYAVLMRTAREEACVNHFIVDLSRQIKKLKEHAKLYAKHIQICNQEIAYLEEYEDDNVI